MYPRPFRSLAAFALTVFTVGGIVAHAGPAFAAGEKDKEALKLHDQAMDEDYLAVEFDKAEKKLKDALKKCGDDACSAKVVGKLHIALGTVYGGSSKMDQAKEEFVLALKADPNAALLESFTTPELTKAFDKAKEAAKPAKPVKPPPTPEPPKGGGEDGGDEDGGGDKKPAGDLDHKPVPEQAVNTPVPIYIEAPDDVEITKGSVKYKPFGTKEWKSVAMTRVGEGWGAEIPCEDVTTTGDVKYYITLTDDAGDTLKAGSKKEPYKVSIKSEIEGDEPSLPGKKPAKQCAAKEDCPPGLAGCPSGKPEKRGDKGWGATCEADTECQSSLICQNGQCEEGKRNGGEEGPTPADGKGKKNIIGLGGQLDLMVINSAEDVCTGNNDTYYCFYPGGSNRFFGEPISAANTNGIQGGFAMAGGTAFASYDRELVKLGSGALGAGLRFGVAFGGHPTSDETPPDARHPALGSFPPIRGDVRAWYSFLGSAFEEGKVRPYGFLGFGIGKVSASVPVSVCDQREKNGTDQIGAADDECNKSIPAVRRDLDAYQISGLNYVTVGAGATYAITSNFGVTGEIKVLFMVPTFAIVLAPSLGPVFAF